MKILIVLLFVLFAGCDVGLKEEPFVQETIKYEVTGSAVSVVITLVNQYGAIEGYAGAILPWERSFETIAHYSICIFVENENITGIFTVNVYRNGSLVKSGTGSKKVEITWG